MTDYEEGQRFVLRYLIRVAEETKGAEVWRALFAEALGNVVKSAKLRDALTPCQESTARQS